MKNRDVAHQFFYDYGGSFNRVSMTVSYCYDRYYSYATAIGQIAETITGRTICILSDNNFSNTTAKHIRELRQACPFDVIYLPQERGNRGFLPATVVDTCIRNLKYYAKSKLSQKPNRENLSKYYEMLKDTLVLKGFGAEFERTKKALDEFREIYKSVNDPEKLKTLKALQAEKEKQQKEELKKELENLLSKYSYLTLIKETFSDFYGNTGSLFDAETKRKLKRYFNPKNELSFIWFEGDYVRTSQHITVNRKEAETLLKLWAKGKLKHGMRIKHYTVLEVMASYVKVGCHKIPAENLKALLAEISDIQTIEEAA